METLRIQQFQARYHLVPSMFDQQDRLDRVLAEMLDGALGPALERLGISPREEICIRRVCVPVRLQNDSADNELILEWSMALAQSIHETIAANNQDNIIRYSSRIDGFLDFAGGVARGNFHRAWAWHRMDFSVDPRIDSTASAAAGLVTSLVREPEYILPVLTALAATGEIGDLLHRLEPLQWRDLAMAALSAHGVNAENPVAVLKNKDGTKKVSGTRTIAVRIVNQSMLAQTVALERPRFSTATELLSTWGIFIVLETEPGLFRNNLNTSAAILDAIEKKLGQELRDPPEIPLQAPEAGIIPKKEALDGRRECSSQTVPGPGKERGPDSAAGRDESASSGTLENRWNGPVDVPAGGSTRNMSEEEERRMREPVEDDILSRSRNRGFTEFGGLLFLLPTLEHSGVIDEIIASEQFAGRTLGWFLHGLALGLLPARGDDPAVLAFCGLAPHTPLPWKDEPGADETEKQLLAHWRLKIIDTLSAQVSGQDMEPERLLYTVCCRKAEIVVDPGWFEVIFSLRDVSTEIRRAGLDLDPGFIPWLGVIIKYYYE